MAKVTQEYNLQATNPSLAKQWHRAKNGTLTPMDVAPYSWIAACPYKHGYATHFTCWIQKGLPYTTRSTARYFTRDDVEDFLKKSYGISIKDFKQHLKEKER